ncbi:Potassium channel domain [Dillenia turbinata]|uniref:Potassium channel domain n=1 Tax=Dillenia turbinata TaxID=194707 RepID=A0AAN8ZRK7_9MAGN
MASNSINQPLLNPSHHLSQLEKSIAPRKRFRRCRSAPLAELVPSDVNEDGSLPRSRSIFSKLHPGFKKVCLFLTIYLGVGTVCFYLFGDQIKGEKTNVILDALYLCIVTMTTVGYGDLVPNSVPTKLFACAFVFMGMALVGLILSKAADYMVEKQEILLVKALHISRAVGPTEILKEMETNKVRYKCIMTFILLLALISIGTTFLATVEKLDTLDAFYCVCSTITTLGYGDRSFSTSAGRAFAVFWILTSTVCVAQFFLYLAEVSTESRQKALAKWVLNRRMTNVDLEAADLDEDGVVGVAEFILYKLKEMGKVSQEDISLAFEEFEDLDVDQSGTLSLSDLALSQRNKEANK